MARPLNSVHSAHPMSFWLQNLNPEQREAVLHDHGPLLILAGAGSGKTTVLVSRTGRLIAEGLTTPERICVLTFTNKAANELKHRVAKKLGGKAEKVWAGTFHGFGLQFLKEHWKEAELPKRFGIIDGGDALSVLKDLLKEHKSFEKERFDLENLMNRIGDIRAKKKNSHDETIEAAMAEVLAPKYLRKLKNLGVVDFEELLMKPLKMMQESEAIRNKMQARYDFLMVDEFQDTNHTQMKFVDMLTAGHNNIAVVGDDDQSIYGWRGAEIRNILDFPKRYKKCNVVKLERNYRSSGKILDLANAIIGTNKDRHTKVLRSGLDQPGELPELFTFENEDIEVDQVVTDLQNFKRKGYNWRDIAILYRSNSQGGLMEGGLRRTEIPYKLTGGTALFDRKEAKDCLAYIRCSIFPTEVSFRRVINLPARGVGDVTLDAIEAVEGKYDFYQKTRVWAKTNTDEKAAEAISNFLSFLEDFKTQLIHSPRTAEEVLEEQLRMLGYRDYVNQSYRDPQAADRRWLSITILGRILNGMFEKQGRNLMTLEKFIDLMELRDLSNDDDADKDQVQMMTLHACKGLEFPLVYLLGLEEDLLPHAKLGGDVDEERRLFYVGVTRAKKHLILTRVRERKRYGRLKPVAPSRFLMEIDRALVKEMNGGRPLEVGQRESLMAELMKKLDKKIADRDVE